MFKVNVNGIIYRNIIVAEHELNIVLVCNQLEKKRMKL